MSFSARVRVGLLVGITILLIAALFAISKELPSVQSMPQTVTSYRVIGAWQGRVAVFLPNSDIPECVYEVALASLPPTEQERLREGVAVGDAAELKKRLEDYLS